jgi:ankyrin repeat protein
MYASRSGNLETVMEMVPYCKIEEVERAIFLAAENGHHALVRTLLEKTDVSPNAIASDGWGSSGSIHVDETLLMVATGSLEPKSVRLLLQKGANVHTSTPLTPDHPFLWSRWRYPDRGDTLGGRTALHRLAIAANNQKFAAVKEILNILLATGAEINARDVSGNTPLLLTVPDIGLIRHDSSSAVLDLFLAAGSDPCALNTDGDTLLHRACKNLGNTDITATLLRYKANPNQARFKSGKTPLHL